MRVCATPINIKYSKQGSSMNKILLSLAMSGVLSLAPTQIMAKTLPYYAQGEDIDNIINGDEASVITQLEEKILALPILRELHGYFFNIQYLNDDNTEDFNEYTAGSDDDGGC